VRDVNIFATWKARIVYLLVALGIGAWLSVLEGWPLAACLVVALATGIVQIWWELRKHDRRRRR
jgi:hypothetical protein